MKRDRTLVILTVVAAVLAALVLWDRHRPSTDEAARRREHLLPAFSRAAATTIDVERRGHVTHLRHEASGWWLAEPHRRADDDQVDALLAVLQYGEIERRVPVVDGKMRALLGLDHPRAVVRVEGHTLRVGADSPARGVYVQRDGEPDALVAEHRLVELADLDPRLWRSMRLTLANPAAAHSIASGEGWTLARRGGWRVVRPVDARANGAKVDALVQALSRARAVREIDPPAGTPPGGPALSLDGAVQAHRAGDCDVAGQARVARADGAWLCFRAADLDLVRTPAVTYYERRLFPMRLDDVVAADVGPLHLRRADGVWRIVAPAEAAGPARDEAVRAWLEPLLAAEAHGFSPAPVAGGVRVRLATRDDEVTATVAGSTARRAGDSVTLELAQPLSPSTDPGRAARAAARPIAALTPPAPPLDEALPGLTLRGWADGAAGPSPGAASKSRRGYPCRR